MQWKKTPCADKYSVQITGQKQKVWTTDNYVEINATNTCQGHVVLVEAFLGGKGSGAVPADFNPCARERKPNGGLPRWVQKNMYFTQKESQDLNC